MTLSITLPSPDTKESVSIELQELQPQLSISNYSYYYISQSLILITLNFMLCGATGGPPREASKSSQTKNL